MTPSGVAAVVLLGIGIVLGSAVVQIVAVVLVLIEAVRITWARGGLTDVRYSRHFERDRIGWGEEVPATIEVWNRKRVPLSWLRADDSASPGLLVRERPLLVGKGGDRVLRNAWTLAPFERVSRRFHVTGERRGVYELGPVDLSVGDLFAREAAAEVRPGTARLIVRPRIVAAEPVHRRDRWGGTDRALFGLAEDPTRYAGLREYAPGDPLRRVHPRASARAGRPLVKVHEPSRDREALIALDVAAGDGRGWDVGHDEETAESLFVIAASLARTLAEERASFGLAAAAWTGSESRLAIVAPSEAPGQLERVLDLLARLSVQPSVPFDRLLGAIIRSVRAGTTVIVVTARDPGPFVRHLRRLERVGLPVVLLACGPNGEADAGRV
ncbi:MAG TPA: DUF58 domain-containing protein, partial [Candidatus Limnocylindrales bacterium]|nr:DUF58 domain-containing protein [Candidatus Limnocylindrales bacterium]